MVEWDGVRKYAVHATLALGAAFVTSKIVNYANIRLRARGKPLPVPNPLHWLYGSIPLLAERVGKNEEHIDQVLVDLMREDKSLGKLFVLKLVAIDMVIVCDAEACKEVLMTHNYAKSFTYDTLHPFIGSKSILVADEPTWARQRKAFNPGFSFGFLRSQVPVFAAKTLELLDTKLAPRAADGGVVLLHNEATLLTLDIICRIALSEDFGCLAPGGPPALYTAFADLITTTAEYARAPHLMWTRYLPWNWLRWRGLQARFDSHVTAIIRRRLADSKASQGSGPKDILGLAIDTCRAEGDRLDLLELTSQLKTFLFAGHDTTATTISFAVYEIARNPAIEAKVLEEVDRVLGGRAPNADDLAALKYLNCCVKESLRLWPPAGTARIAPPGTTLQGYDIGRKVMYIPHFPIHRDPDYWGPDACVYRPERWQDENYVAALHPCAYQPFSKGSRDCIGQTLALMEAKTVLALLYQRYVYRYVGTSPEAQAYHITSYPKHHVPVTVHAREALGLAPKPAATPASSIPAATTAATPAASSPRPTSALRADAPSWP